MQNNLLFDDVHYYLILMSHIEKLKQKAEYQVLAEDVPQEQLKEIMNMRNRIIVGLLRCGLDYEYIKDAECPEKDIIRFTIDNINYDCSVKTIKNILKEDFSLFIKEADIYDRKINESKEKEVIERKINENKIQKSSKIKLEKNEEKPSSINENVNIKTEKINTIIDETIIDEKMAELFLIHEIDTKSKEAVKIEENKNNENENDNIYVDYYNPELRDSKDSSEIESVELLNNEQFNVSDVSTSNITNEKNTEELKEEIEEQAEKELQYEMTKKIDSFLYDIVEIEIFQPGATVGEKMLLNIMPIKIEENNIHPKIAVAISSKTENGIKDTMVFVSKKATAIQLEYKGYQLLVRGTFKKGVFTSYIIASGTTSAIGCSINSEVIKIRGKENVNYGHICFEENNVMLHVLPLTEINEANGFAHFMVCYEENNQYNVIQNINGNAIRIDFQNGEHIMLKGYYLDNYFSIEKI